MLKKLVKGTASLALATAVALPGCATVQNPAAPKTACALPMKVTNADGIIFEAEKETDPKTNDTQITLTIEKKNPDGLSGVHVLVYTPYNSTQNYVNMIDLIKKQDGTAAVHTTPLVSFEIVDPLAAAGNTYILRANKIIDATEKAGNCTLEKILPPPGSPKKIEGIGPKIRV